MASNRTIIIGRLGETPELREANRGCKANCYTTFRLSNTTLRDGVEETLWHTIVCFGKQAYTCCENLSKGDVCCIEGHLDKRAYEKNGEARYSRVIIAEHITFLRKSVPENPEPRPLPGACGEP